MQGGPKPQFLQKPVAYYVMGAERWRYADTLEAARDSRSRTFWIRRQCRRCARAPVRLARRRQRQTGPLCVRSA